MSEKTLFLKFWQKEAPATRKVISRIPEGSDYRPDSKSRTAREIAWLIVREEIVHHRGQISTYLRPMGSTVPQIYGPSADEPM